MFVFLAFVETLFYKDETSTKTKIIKHDEDFTEKLKSSAINSCVCPHNPAYRYTITTCVYDDSKMKHIYYNVCINEDQTTPKQSPPFTPATPQRTPESTPEPTNCPLITQSHSTRYLSFLVLLQIIINT